MGKNFDNNGLFKDVEAEEYDLEDSAAPLVDDRNKLEDLKKISDATRRAAL